VVGSSFDLGSSSGGAPEEVIRKFYGHLFKFKYQAQVQLFISFQLIINIKPIELFNLGKYMRCGGVFLQKKQKKIPTASSRDMSVV